MKMKKLTALLLATLMVLSLAACGAKGDKMCIRDRSSISLPTTVTSSPSREREIPLRSARRARSAKTSSIMGESRMTSSRGTD